MIFQLLNDEGDILAEGNAEVNADQVWCGRIVTNNLPEDLLLLFAELNSAVNDQMFPLADRIGTVISQHDLVIRLQNGRTMAASDIYVNEHLQVSWQEKGA